MADMTAVLEDEVVGSTVVVYAQELLGWYLSSTEIPQMAAEACRTWCRWLVLLSEAAEPCGVTVPPHLHNHLTTYCSLLSFHHCPCGA